MRHDELSQLILNSKSLLRCTAEKVNFRSRITALANIGFFNGTH